MAYLMIVDDDPDFAASVATVCESMGHEVTTVHTTNEALQRMASRCPDGLVLDVMFPEDPAGGFELARKVQRQQPGLPILLLTAVNQQFPLGFSNKDIDPKWLPVVDFLEKPVDFTVLSQRITQLLARRASGH